MGRPSWTAHFSVTSTRGLRLSREGDTHVIAAGEGPMSRTAELTHRTYPISTSYPHALTGHRQRASLALLLIAVVFCMLYAPLPARADWYLFSRFNAIGGSQQNSLVGPAINASGQLVFYQGVDQSIYKADLVTQEKIVTTKLHSLSSPFVSLGTSPRINDLGDVGFMASRAQRPFRSRPLHRP